MVFFDCTCLNILSITLALIIVSVSYIKWRLNFWQRRGVTTPPPTFLFGNIGNMLLQRESYGDMALRIYNYLRNKNVAFGGLYTMTSPVFMPVDPNLIKSLLITDFEYFVDRGVYINEEGDPLSAHLFALEGAKWKNLRTKLTPTFTSGKMKMMFETLVKCSDNLQAEMDKKAGQAIDIKDILSRFTTDIIGSCAFGIDCNSLKNPDNEFNKHGKLFFEFPFWWNFVTIMTLIFPGFMKKFNTPAIYPSLSKFFGGVVKDTVAYREKNNVYRKDFMHLLLQLKNKGQITEDESVLETAKDGDKKMTLSIDEIAAQALIFFLAGFETSSTTMTFCLYELACNQDIQEKLRKEIEGTLKKYDGKVTYDAIMEMQYMEKVINETLRKYPPLPGLDRICNKDYKVPGTNLVLKKGSQVFVSVLGLHRDEEYYPDPEIFDPERFSEENKRARPPCAFIPFGDGPRICIGMRFGLMQTKVGLATLLNNYRFKVSPKTKQPVDLDPRNFILSIKGGLWLDYTKI